MLLIGERADEDLVLSRCWFNLVYPCSTKESHDSKRLGFSSARSESVGSSGARHATQLGSVELLVAGGAQLGASLEVPRVMGAFRSGCHREMAGNTDIDPSQFVGRARFLVSHQPF